MKDSGLCVNCIREEIDKKGEIQLQVHGNSMLPTLCDEVYITIEKCNTYKIKIGDVVAYLLSFNKIIVHRVIQVRKNYVLTKGDNNKFIDPLKVTYDKIMGIVNI